MSPIKRFDKAKTTKLVDKKNATNLGQKNNLLQTTGYEIKPQTQMRGGGGGGGEGNENGGKGEGKKEKKMK